MKVALVVPGGVDRSGRERVVPVLLWLIERLSQRHTVHVIVLDYYSEPCDYELLGAAVHDVGRVAGPPGFRRYRLEHRLSHAIATHGPFDVLHAYLGMPAGVVATAVGRGMRIPVVATLSSGELVRFDDIGYGLQRRWLDRRAMTRVFRRAAAITVPTAYMAALLEPHGVVPAIVPMGIDTRLFINQPGDRAAHARRLIRVGSINAVKDHPTLIQAMAMLPPDVTLDIVGEDTLGGRVQALARTLKVDHRITFHGWQPTDRLAALYAAASLNIVSSRHEACNVTMLEAACTGVPTVGSAVGYVADWSPDRAVAVPPRNPRALADAIDALLGDAPRRARIAAAARTWTLEHDADSTAAAFEALYARVIRG